MSVNEASGFLEQIIAHPDDDTPRLIFADWLEEQGETARAEFIRVQVERATLPAWDARQLHLRLRERALLKQHGGEWKRELPQIEGVVWEEFRRGFVATARFASFALFGSQVSACWAAAPIEAVSARWPREDDDLDTLAPIAGLRELSITGRLMDLGDVGRLANLSMLSTLRSLNVRNANLGTEGFQWLVASPHLGNLAALRVPGNSIGNRAIRGLIAAPALTSLSELDLSEAASYNRYGEDPVLQASGLTTLARWPGLFTVRSLTLSGNDIKRKGLRALLQSPHVTNLKELVIRANGLNDQAMKEFKDANSELRLDLLDLGENFVGDVGPSDLALAPCLDELKELRLDRCEIRAAGALWLTRARFVETLRLLNANHNNFGPEGLYTLLECKPPLLHTLQMVDNDLGDEGVLHLAESSASDALQHVSIEQNGISDHGAKSLLKSPHLQNLLVLQLASNSISEPAAAAFAKSPLGKRLAVLELSQADHEGIPW